MSPYEIKLLLDICSVADWYKGRVEPILNQTIIDFCSDELITYTGSLDGVKITPRGRAHVSQLCNLDYPTASKIWIDKHGNKIPDTI